MHIIDKLHEDHEKVESLFRKLKDTTDGAEKTRADLSAKLRQELLAHSEFEENVFYPTVRERDGVGRQVKQAFEEHQEVKQMLDELDSMDPTSAEFMETVAELEAAVREHVDVEESDIFPAAKKAIGEDEGAEMARRHDEAARQFMQELR